MGDNAIIPLGPKPSRVSDPYQLYTALVLGASAVLMFGLGLLASLHVRSLGEDVLRSRMFLKAHLLRRGYLLLVFASVGMLFLGVPLLLGASIPWVYVLAASIVGLGCLDLALLSFYFVVAPRENPLSTTLNRLADLLRRFHDKGPESDDRG